MEIPTKYDPSQSESKWYAYWMEKGFFRSLPDKREPYCIVIPPPNVTGVLHMGHMLNNTLQDVLVRRARMLGKNALWVPGTDHASIATEAKVVEKLKAEGITKNDISREQFLEHAWEWTHKHGGIILEQLKKLGASCDWDRTVFTMDDPRYESVIRVFVDLYNKGLIYRGVRMVNWDPEALTAVSDEEVVYKEVQSKLYYFRYRIEGEENGWVTIATTRPETILGDTAVCVHPEDERYAHLKGKKILIPLINRAVPLIFDEYVDREFGTGALKVTPAHDVNDYALGAKHGLDSIDIFTDTGTLNEKALLFIGDDRFSARKKITGELEAQGHLVKIEEISNSIGYSQRTNAVIEPKLSMQWFLRMADMSKSALDVVMNDSVAFHPPKFKNIYQHWMENLHDWCISRQLWWGQRIPAYYLPDGKIVVAADAGEALRIAREKFGKEISAGDLKQDEDVLDTWFSSWLWPISVFDGIRDPENEEIRYYYPTSDLITAPDIIFFWVARMIMAGMEYRQQIPFSNVYFTGMVRDKIGRKMSKSLGNSPDPVALMGVYGADGVRVGMLLCSPAGNDLLFDESLCEQGRNFSNKIWNAFRLVKGWTVDENLKQPEVCAASVRWFTSKFNHELAQANSQFEKYRISDALMTLYKLMWDDFCSWYLEMIKPAFTQPVDRKTYEATTHFFDLLLKALHPFMPFITEELWHMLAPRKDGETIMLEPWPQAENADAELLKCFDFASDVISAIRSIRKERNISPREPIALMVKKNNNEKPDETFDCVALKLCNISGVTYVEEKPEGTISFMAKSTEFFIPAAGAVNMEEELAKLAQELQYQQGFLNSVMKKLGNENFVRNASPQIVENERKKKEDAESKIKVIEEQIQTLRSDKK
jgi:valyl-tRNA synthetase